MRITEYSRYSVLAAAFSVTRSTFLDAKLSSKWHFFGNDGQNETKAKRITLKRLFTFFQIFQTVTLQVLWSFHLNSLKFHDLQ